MKKNLIGGILAVVASISLSTGIHAQQKRSEISDNNPQSAKLVALPNTCGALAYPAISKREGEQGKVEIEIRVRPNGDLFELKIVSSSGFKALDTAALKAVSSCRFENRNDSVDATKRVEYSFRLN